MLSLKFLGQSSTGSKYAFPARWRFNVWRAVLTLSELPGWTIAKKLHHYKHYSVYVISVLDAYNIDSYNTVLGRLQFKL